MLSTGLKQRKVEASIVATGNPRSGFASNEEGFVVAVVPRFWFPQKIPDGIIDETKIIIMPDKGKRKFICTLDDVPKRSVITSDNKKVWVDFRVEADTSLDVDYSEEDTDADGRRLQALYALLLEDGGENHEDEVLSLTSSSFEFNVFLFKSMLDTVRNEMRELRRSYKEVLVRSPAIRGRIDFKSSLPLIAAEIPEMICITDEFSVSSPHYSALMTSLDFIASETSEINNDSTYGFLSSLITTIGEEAMETRARFREIPSMPYGQAIRTLRIEPIPSQLRKWRPLFGFALMVLEGEGANAEAGGHTLEASVLGGTMWEHILERVLKMVTNQFDESFVEVQACMWDPWVKEGGNMSLIENEKNQIATGKKKPTKRKTPDFWIGVRDKDLVIDAKYYDNINAAFLHNNYQMLAYALSPLQREKEAKGEERRGPRAVSFVVPHHTMDTYDKQMDKTEAAQNEDFSSIVLQHDPKKPKNTSRYEMQLPYTIREEGGKTPFLQGLSMQFPPMKVYLDEKIWAEWHKQATKSMKSILDEMLSEI